jgi:rRNA maturation endonuclease Nob1
MLELIAGIVVAFVAVAAVLQPLLVQSTGRQAGGSADPSVEFEVLEESESPKVQALLALKEIEFDRATGKLSDTDYQQLKAKYSALALEAIKAEEAGEAAQAEGDAAEELVRQAAAGKMAVCPDCGPRPEADAAFCADCGQPLTRSESTPEGKGRFCEACGNALTTTAKFCDACGVKVGAQPAGSVS